MRAAQALDNRQIEMIVITRPTVETGGEKLGFFPANWMRNTNPILDGKRSV
jgi:phosphate starvation-inducible protein PhoH